MKKTIKEHFIDLRNALICFGVPLVILFGILFYFSPIIINWIIIIMKISNPVALTPFESISTQLRFSLGMSFLMLMPMGFLLMYKFLSDELNVKIKRKLLSYTIPSIILGIFGIMFGTFVFSNFVLNFLIQNSIVQPIMSIKSIIDFIIISAVTFALVFQIIIIIPLIVNSDIISKTIIKKARIPLLISCLIISAMVTPPDVISQVFMAVPIYGSFELGLLFSRNKEVGEYDRMD